MKLNNIEALILLRASLGELQLAADVCLKIIREGGCVIKTG